MAIFGAAKRQQNNTTELIPIGARVDVISGSYPGHWAVIVGHTPKKYHVRLDSGHDTLLAQSSVRLSDTQPISRSSRERNFPSYEALIRAELAKIQASIAEIGDLMNKLRIAEEEAKL